VVDLSCPRDTVVNPHTLTPIWLGPEQHDVAALTKRLDDPDPAVACDAAWALKRNGPISDAATAAKVFSALTRAWKESDNLQVQLMAAEALKGLGTLSAERLAAVEEAMVGSAPKRDPHAFVLLAEILKDMGESGAKTVRSAMTRALPAVRNPDLFVQIVGELSRSGPDGMNAATAAVLQALKGTEVCLFEAAAGQVKGLGDECIKQATPLLEKVAQQQNTRIGKAAADTLVTLGQVLSQ
jgi:HEAT repeat protein